MVFSCAAFLFCFLPVSLGIYFLCPRQKVKNVWLILISLLFYGFSGPQYVLLLLFSVCCNYLAGLYVWGRKWVLAAAVIINLGLLGIFKYLGFLVCAVNELTSASITIPSIALPVGISFFTFQGLSYVIDVYRDESLRCTHIGDVLLYISFFPQLVAGPIVRYEDIAHEIYYRSHTLEQLACGLRRFVIGLSKKLLVADTCGSVVDLIYNAENSVLDSRTAWLAAVCYLMQIYFDFSGYSDMAIGLGRCFGFNFKENFNYPYIAASIREFWRRWHISLSTWFREYLYIPLGGNRQGEKKELRNKLIVFICTGLWHGANWTFLVWGLWQGGFSLLEEIVEKRLPSRIKNDSNNGWWRGLRHLYTLFVVMIGFVIFRAADLSQAGGMILALFSGQNSSVQTELLLAQCLTPLTLFALILGIMGSTPLFSKIYHSAVQREGCVSQWGESLSYVGALVLLILDILHLSAASYMPFIYFQF